MSYQDATPMQGAPQAAYSHAATPPVERHVPPQAPQQAPPPQQVALPQQSYVPPPQQPYVQPAQPYVLPQPVVSDIAGVPAGMTLAGIGARIGAGLIDSVLVSLIAVACYAPFVVIGVLTEDEVIFAILAAVGSLVGLIFTIRYYVRGHSTTGQTRGQKWLKIKVVGEDGALISKGKAFWRLMAQSILTSIIISATAGLGLLIYLIPLLDSRRRALHDMICKTLVVDAQ
jgi:uncharacterized RDD family membrane protein YckC